MRVNRDGERVEIVRWDKVSRWPRQRAEPGPSNAKPADKVKRWDLLNGNCRFCGKAFFRSKDAPRQTHNAYTTMDSMCLLSDCCKKHHFLFLVEAVDELNSTRITRHCHDRRGTEESGS